MNILMGSIGFVLFFVYDINSVKLKIKGLNSFFSIGCVCVLIGATYSTIMESNFNMDKNSVILMAVALLCFLLSFYTLFFAIPFKESYVTSDGKRKVCSVGMYGFCRHPGVIWLGMFFVFLALALQSNTLFSYGIIMSIWNLLYVVFQDNYTFLHYFEDYEAYKKEVPFLIPNKGSIKRGVTTWPGRGENYEI